jgi:predicted nucleic acid-binding protein
MPYLLDTSILVRLANQSDALHAVADAAITELLLRNEALCITAQNLIEFRNAATRPKAINGLGLTIAEAESKSAIFESSFSLLRESPDIFPAWKALVMSLGVVGKTVHDARLVAACHVNSVTHLLTFNTPQFTTMAKFGPGVIIVDPANV